MSGTTVLSLCLQLVFLSPTSASKQLLYLPNKPLFVSPVNTKGGCTVPLTSCLTGLESAVWQQTIFVFICITDLSKPVKQVVNGIVILFSFVFLHLTADPQRLLGSPLTLKEKWQFIRLLFNADSSGLTTRLSHCWLFINFKNLPCNIYFLIKSFSVTALWYT